MTHKDHTRVVAAWVRITNDEPMPFDPEVPNTVVTRLFNMALKEAKLELEGSSEAKQEAATRVAQAFAIVMHGSEALISR